MTSQHHESNRWQPATDRRRVALAIGLGTLGAVFFSSTFLINRTMAESGGHWIWSGSLRFGYTAAILATWLAVRGQLRPFLRFFRSTWSTWLRWGTIGFGGFYTLLCVAAELSPAWLVAGAFQVTLVAGLLLAPFIYRDERRIINERALRLASLVVLGAVLMQVENVTGGIDAGALAGFVLVLVASALYPLGNRQILLFLEDRPTRFSALQVIFGMTLGSLPWWITLSGAGLAAGVAPPAAGQLLGTLAVAVSAGIVAMGLFYAAMGLAGSNGTWIGAVESTQSVELLATLLIEVTVLGAALPGPAGWIGSALVILGIALYARLR